MENRYIEGIDVPRFDLTVDDIIEECESPPEGGPFVIAIENEEKEVYRIITTYGIPQLLALTEGLQQMGLKDVLYEQSGPSPEGYDARFCSQD